MTSGHTGDTDAGNARCAQLRQMLDRVGDTWSLLAVTALREEPRRFNQLRRDLPGISSRMLTRTLRALERDGLVRRTVYPTVPPQVDYGLTPLGSSLLTPVEALFQWALDHQPQMDAARAGFDRQNGDASRNG
jgi:DNA-binding HxlR family transcriptional regulator